MIQEIEKSRLVWAFGYIAMAAVILGAAFSLAILRRQEVGVEGIVSVSHAVVTRSDVRFPNNSGIVTTASDGLKKAAKPKDSDFVRVREYVPDIAVELMYATDRNFTGKVIYDFSDAWLRFGTVKKLAHAQEILKKRGVRIKIWDAFRPVSAQFKLWKVCPDPKFVSNPVKGFSSHSRGNTVDVTLVDEDGNALVMPTGFDDFTGLADRDYSDIEDKTAISNAKLLETVMKECGFRPYAGEWWHFSDRTGYDVAADFIPQ